MIRDDICKEYPKQCNTEAIISLFKVCGSMFVYVEEIKDVATATF